MRFSPGCQCCGSGQCCSGDAPSALSLVITGVAGIFRWDQCTNANGTFTLNLSSTFEADFAATFHAETWLGGDESTPRCYWVSEPFDLDSTDPESESRWLVAIVKQSATSWLVGVRNMTDGEDWDGGGDMFYWFEEFTSAPNCAGWSSYVPANEGTGPGFGALIQCQWVTAAPAITAL